MANYSKIKLLAKKKGVTLHEVARAVGITPVGISRIIRENTIRPSTLEKICEYFDVSQSYFFVDDDNYTNYESDETPTATDAIKAEMERQRVSGRELAARIKMRQQRLWYLLNEARTIKDEDLETIATGLKIDPQRLYALPNGKPKPEPLIVPMKHENPHAIKGKTAEQIIADLQKQLNESQRTIADLASANRALSEQLYGGRTPAGYIPSKRNPNDPF